MGIVYIAEHIETEEVVALKVMMRSSSDSGDISRFRQEAKIATKLASEHVVRVIDAGVDTATKFYFLVMELLQGEDLEAMVTRDGALPFTLVADLMLQLTGVLARAHEFRDSHGVLKPIVHRDLKPENLFVCRRRGRPMLKVLDFGIAKVVSASISISGAARGTPLYMAREQFANEAITPAVDVWAFGLIAFRLLTGGQYWKTAETDAPSLPALCAEILNNDPPAAASGRAPSTTLPEGFDDWLRKCLAGNPSARHPSIRVAGIELAAILDPNAVVDWEEPSAASNADVSSPTLGVHNSLALAPTITATSNPTEKGTNTYVLVGGLMVAAAALVVGLMKASGSSNSTAAAASAIPPEPTPIVEPKITPTPMLSASARAQSTSSSSALPATIAPRASLRPALSASSVPTPSTSASARKSVWEER
jgi:serine/threonine-protein kinase